MTTKILDTWKRRANQLRIEAYAIYLAYKDSRVPWYAKIFIVCIIGYLFSPIDKFLDSIPIMGYVDHLILVPIGVALALKRMIPPMVFTDCREKARIAMNRKEPVNWGAGSIVIFIWFLFASFAIVYTTWVMKDWSAVLKLWFGWFMRMTKLQNHMPAHGGV
jgi:uncharacterized membrane protein YkvA (DUF1232 family)